jgi:hypothetical protein
MSLKGGKRTGGFGAKESESRHSAGKTQPASFEANLAFVLAGR